MDGGVGIGRAVGSNEQLATVKIRRVHRRELDLARPLGKPRGALLRGCRCIALMVHLPHSRAGTAGVHRLVRLCGQNGSFVISGSLALNKVNCVHGTCGQTVAKAIAVVVAQQFRFAVHHADGPLVAGLRACAAAVAFFLIDLNDSPFHQNHSVSFVLALV